jgi:hypothetical protein
MKEMHVAIAVNVDNLRASRPIISGTIEANENPAYGTFILEEAIFPAGSDDRSGN